MSASPIRPSFVMPQPASAPVDAARLAQRAFFQAALAQAAAPTQTGAPLMTARVAPTQGTAWQAVESTANGAERYARPGSRLDIRV